MDKIGRATELLGEIASPVDRLEKYPVSSSITNLMDQSGSSDNIIALIVRFIQFKKIK